MVLSYVTLEVSTALTAAMNERIFSGSFKRSVSTPLETSTPQGRAVLIGFSDVIRREAARQQKGYLLCDMLGQVQAEALTGAAVLALHFWL